MDFVGLARDVLGGWGLVRGWVRFCNFDEASNAGTQAHSPGIMMLHFGSSLPRGPRCWRGGRLYVVASEEKR
jgi:hypothetical protein